MSTAIQSTHQNSPPSDLQPATAHKKRKSIKPPAVQTAVMAKYMTGESKTKISKDLDISRNTINKILSVNEIEQQVLLGRSDCIRMIPKSIKVIDQKLKKGSETAALAILRGTNVLQNQALASVTNNYQANTWIMMKQQKQAEQSQAIEIEAKAGEQTTISSATTSEETSPKP